MPLSEDFRTSSDSSSDQAQVGGTHCDLVNALGTRLTESLKIQQDQKATSIMGLYSDSNDASDKVRCVDREEPTGIKLENFVCGKSLNKCATFPCAVKGKSLLSTMFDGTIDPDNHSTAQDLSPVEHTESDNHPYPRSFSLPTHSILKSALKGSREKSGTPPEKLSVSWAPDVYDPPPTSASHVPSRSQRYRSNNKKNGKNKQKGSGKGTRGTKGKDKKKSRKHSGFSSPSFSNLDNSLDMDDDKVASCSGPQASCVDYEAGKPDPFCGHSFLKKSVTRMHFPVAEAT